MPRLVLFCHSLRSDWNHGNAHFLRGMLSELRTRGWGVLGLEPQDGWSARNLAADHGEAALGAWRAAYPALPIGVYDPAHFDLDRALADADLVLVHEWSQPALVARIAAHRRRGGRYLLLFHDTHHRMVSDPEAIAAFELDGFDAVLAFGEAVRARYLAQGWGPRAFTWHEAADTRLFRPHPEVPRRYDVAWIGNWGDGERSAELREYLTGPIAALALKARVHGVRYPDAALAELAAGGIEFAGYLPNFEAPAALAAVAATVHIPRRPYARMLPGIPTIRVFEALACGVPLVSAPWEDCEGLFAPGEDYLVAASGAAMRDHLAALRADRELAAALARRGPEIIAARHSCAHRADELVAICRRLGRDFALPEPAAAQ